MQKLLSIFSLVFLFAVLGFGQAVDIPVTLTNNLGASQVLNYGLDLTATTGIDPALGESALPPAPPPDVFFPRFDLTPYGFAGIETYKDYRNAPAWPFSGAVEHRLMWQIGTGATTITVNYNLPPEATMHIIDPAAGGFFNSGILTGAGSWLFTPSFFTYAIVTIQYTNIGPSAPVFTINPPSLDFGSVNVGSPSVLQATVTNTGTGTLNISNVVSSDAQFTFAPTVFPIVVAPGGNAIFNVTFTPAAGGLQTGTLTFTHDAAGSPFVYNVQGTGYVPAPIFGTTPPSLDFGTVNVGANAVLPVTVNNTGDAELIISNLVSSDPQYTFAPNTFPVNVPAGGNTIFNVTFTPTAAGPQPGVLTFTHNAAGSPTPYAVLGTGHSTAPFFSIDPISLAFGQVSVGQFSTLPVTVTNSGDADLSISNIVSSNPLFTFAPNTFPIIIAGGANAIINVTFTPTGAGDELGTLTFTHNAVGSPFLLPVSGTGRTQGGSLEFIQTTRTLYDGTSGNEDFVVLRDYTGQPLRSLQFDILIGKTNGLLVPETVERGTAILDPGFLFDYEIYTEGPSYRVKIVILGVGPAEIPIGIPEQEIVKFTYSVDQITGASATTYNSLENVLGATSTPVVNANLSTGPDEVLTIYNGTPMGLLGDVNLDNQVDMLDILLMIDYILGRVTFTPQQFAMGDISPWTIGELLPVPDGSINVLDLAVLENIVLTGLYPSGFPWNGTLLPKSTPDFFVVSNGGGITPGMNAKITFYISKNGIRVGMESVEKVKGLQMELGEISSLISNNTQLTSIFTKALYHQNNSDLRILVYDSQSNPLEPGKYMVASLPFEILEPEDLTITRVLVADENNLAMDKIEVEIIYEGTTVPTDYMLYQNYPNPFNPSTLVRFSVPQEDFVTIKVYDMLGQEISTLFSGQVQMGLYTVQWNGLDNSGLQMSSGSYIYRMTASGYVQSKKMVLLK